VELRHLGRWWLQLRLLGHQSPHYDGVARACVRLPRCRAAPRHCLLRKSSTSRQRLHKSLHGLRSRMAPSPQGALCLLPTLTSPPPPSAAVAVAYCILPYFILLKMHVPVYFAVVLPSCTAACNLLCLRACAWVRMPALHAPAQHASMMCFVRDTVSNCRTSAPNCSAAQVRSTVTSSHSQ
jgi:hypothetical protein